MTKLSHVQQHITNKIKSLKHTPLINLNPFYNKQKYSQHLRHATAREVNNHPMSSLSLYVFTDVSVKLLPDRDSNPKP